MASCYGCPSLPRREKHRALDNGKVFASNPRLRAAVLPNQGSSRFATWKAGWPDLRNNNFSSNHFTLQWPESRAYALTWTHRNNKPLQALKSKIITQNTALASKGSVLFAAVAGGAFFQVAISSFNASLMFETLACVGDCGSHGVAPRVQKLRNGPRMHKSKVFVLLQEV